MNNAQRTSDDRAEAQFSGPRAEVHGRKVPSPIKRIEISDSHAEIQNWPLEIVPQVDVAVQVLDPRFCSAEAIMWRERCIQDAQ